MLALQFPPAKSTWYFAQSRASWRSLFLTVPDLVVSPNAGHDSHLGSPRHGTARQPTALARPCTWSRRCCRLRRARTHRGRARPSRRRARTACSAAARRARTAAAAACDGHATRAPSRSTARRRREAHASGLGAADASLYRRTDAACLRVR